MAELEAASTEEIGRRKFMTGLIGVVAGIVSAVVALPAIGYVISPGLKRTGGESWLNLGPASAVTPGVPTPFKYSRIIQDGWVKATQSGTAYVVATDAEHLTVFSDRCTHLSCRVTWVEGRNGFICPCHDGVFGIDGKVVAGPPPKPLDAFEHRIENGQIQIHLEA